MATKRLSEMKAEYAKMLKDLRWSDRFVLKFAGYDQLRETHRAYEATRALVNPVSIYLLEAARLKRNIERRKAALSHAH